MSLKRILMFVAVLIVTAVPVFASCTQGDCLVGPCVCFRETGDVNFSDTSCNLWSFTGTASRASSGSSYWGSLPSGIGTIKQTVWGGNTGNTIEVQVDVTVLPSGSPGNEKVYVEVRSTSGSLLETLDIIDANESSGYREYYAEGYGDDVVIQFRHGTGLNDGGSEFRIDNVAFWRCGF
jgi:hypothetical protein